MAEEDKKPDEEPGRTQQAIDRFTAYGEAALGAKRRIALGDPRFLPFYVPQTEGIAAPGTGGAGGGEGGFTTPDAPGEVEDEEDEKEGTEEEPGPNAALDGPGPDEVADLEGQLAAAGEYATFGDWMAAMNTPEGKAQLNTVLSIVSPVRGLVTAVKALYDEVAGTGGFEAGGYQGWGFDIDGKTGAVTDPTTGLSIEDWSFGTGDAGGGLASGPGDQVGGWDVGDDPSGGGWDTSGSEGDDGAADGADGHDTDPGGDF